MILPSLNLFYLRSFGSGGCCLYGRSVKLECASVTCPIISAYAYKGPLISIALQGITSKWISCTNSGTISLKCHCLSCAAVVSQRQQLWVNNWDRWSAGLAGVLQIMPLVESRAKAIWVMVAGENDGILNGCFAVVAIGNRATAARRRIVSEGAAHNGHNSCIGDCAADLTRRSLILNERAVGYFDLTAGVVDA